MTKPTHKQYRAGMVRDAITTYRLCRAIECNSNQSELYLLADTIRTDDGFAGDMEVELHETLNRVDDLVERIGKYEQDMRRGNTPCMELDHLRRLANETLTGLHGVGKERPSDKLGLLAKYRRNKSPSHLRSLCVSLTWLDRILNELIARLHKDAAWIRRKSDRAVEKVPVSLAEIDLIRMRKMGILNPDGGGEETENAVNALLAYALDVADAYMTQSRVPRITFPGEP